MAAANTTVSCPDCTHVVPVYMGEGGLIAAVDGEVEMVDVVAICGNVTASNEMKPDEDGMISFLFTGNLACEDGGTLEIGPVMDGGWYWISDEMHSAVGSLVSKDTLGNDRAKLASAGEGVTMSFPGDDKKDAEDKGAVLLKETSSGRIGILPTILPVPTPAAPARCGAAAANAAGTAFYRRVSSCMQGDGKTVLRAQGPINDYTGKRTTTNRVLRPLAKNGRNEMKFDLWGNGTGHFLTSSTAEPADLAKNVPAGYNFLTGHPGGPPLALTADGNNASSPASGGGMTASLGGVGNNPIATASEGTEAADGGMTFDVEGNVGTLVIHPHDDYCDPQAKPAKNNTATVTVSAYVATGQEAQVTPSIVTAKGTSRLAATTQIMVVCPSGSAAAAHQGRDLVPENPFPPTSE